VPSATNFIFIDHGIGLASIEVVDRNESALILYQWDVLAHNRRMTLELPPLIPDSRYSSLTFASYTNLLHPRYPTTSSPIGPIRYISQGDNIVAIGIVIDGLEEPPGDFNFLLVIDLHALLEVAKPFLDSDSEALIWENWGPLAARCTPLTQHPGFIAVCNWRIVASEQAELVEFTESALKDAGLLPEAQDANDTDIIARFMVFDFNPYRFRRETQSATVLDNTIRWVPANTMELPALKEPVTGGIPYRAWMEKDPTGNWDIVGAGDILILFEVSI
jgi:hypothetical protein